MIEGITDESVSRANPGYPRSGETSFSANCLNTLIKPYIINRDFHAMSTKYEKLGNLSFEWTCGS